MTRKRRHLLVVSHPCVIPENQEVYAELAARGWPLTVVTPDRWRDAYRPLPFAAQAMRDLEGVWRPLPIAFAGYDQRHFYRYRTGKLTRRAQPAVAFLEQEPFSLSALQWGSTLARRGVPFGVQMDENLDRHMLAPIRWSRTWVLRRAAFVAARSPDAAALALRWGARGRIAIVPHAVPAWERVATTPRHVGFTVGFAGRLVEEKGILDLASAVGRMKVTARLLVVGSGPLAARLLELQNEGLPLELREGISHADMPAAFADMDVLVLPSRTTAVWAEQFGRVLVEALWAGVPVVGSNSGAVPWVIKTTGGGRIFPEGDAGALADLLDELAADPDQRRHLGEQGSRVAHDQFGREAAATALEALLDVAANVPPAP